jgi:hypothetical protein
MTSLSVIWDRHINTVKYTLLLHIQHGVMYKLEIPHCLVGTACVYTKPTFSVGALPALVTGLQRFIAITNLQIHFDIKVL